MDFHSTLQSSTSGHNLVGRGTHHPGITKLFFWEKMHSGKCVWEKTICIERKVVGELRLGELRLGKT